MFEHLETGDHVELLRCLCGHGFGGDLPIIDFESGFEKVQARNRQRSLAHVDASHLSATLRHGLAQDAATAADVDDFLSGQRDVLVYPIDP